MSETTVGDSDAESRTWLTELLPADPGEYLCKVVLLGPPFNTEVRRWVRWDTEGWCLEPGELAVASWSVTLGEILEQAEKRNKAARTALVEGRWYWVTDGQTVWPATRDGGRWSNLDTWEDFEGRVCGWRVIAGPPDPDAIMEDFK